jgi:amidase
VVTVESGELLTVETYDAYSGLFDEGLDSDEYLRRRAGTPLNPVTGPIAIEGSEPGDAIAVEIQAIRLAPTGYVAATPGTGLLGDIAVEPDVIAFHVRGESLWMDGDIELPLRAMIGTIGLAPSEGEIRSLELGYHGGNLDFAEITASTTLYLPVQAPGGLLALGDVHASMGLCEAHSGVNISAEVDLRIELLKGMEWTRPWFETAREIMTIGVATELTDALQEAAAAMEHELVRRLEITSTRARMLTGSTVDLRLGQGGGYGVNVSAYAAFPKASLPP